MQLVSLQAVPKKENFTGFHISCGSFITHHPLSLGKMAARQLHFNSQLHPILWLRNSNQITDRQEKDRRLKKCMSCMSPPPKKRTQTTLKKTSKSCSFHVMIKTWDPWHEPWNPGCWFRDPYFFMTYEVIPKKSWVVVHPLHNPTRVQGDLMKLRTEIA